MPVTSFLKRLISEPLVQFLVVGGVLFAIYSAMNPDEPALETQVIEIGPARVTQLIETYQKTWSRAPTAPELDGLIKAFIKEEVYYREGRALGLDDNDTVLRRRMQQKMEFLMEPGADEMTPGEEELQQFLADNRDMYQIPPGLAFAQVFIDPEKHGGAAQAEAERLLAVLEAGPQDERTVSQLGDATLLAFFTPLSPLDAIARQFGRDFADMIMQAETGRWFGPVASAYGLHLVFVDAKKSARLPTVAEIRERLVWDWQAARRAETIDRRYQELRDRYEVRVVFPDTAAASDMSALSDTSSVRARP